MSPAQDPEIPDICDLAKSARLLWNAQVRLGLSLEDYAKARLILEQDSERRKQALSRAVVRSGIDSISKAEHCARKDEKYLEDMKVLDQDYVAAERVRLEWFVTQSKIDSLRTLISAQKTALDNR